MNKTNKELINIIKKHKSVNCPAYSNKKKSELVKIVNNLNLIKAEPTVKKESKKETKKLTKKPTKEPTKKPTKEPKKEPKKEEDGKTRRFNIAKEQRKEYLSNFKKVYGREFNPDKENYPILINQRIKELKEILKKRNEKKAEPKKRKEKKSEVIKKPTKKKSENNSLSKLNKKEQEFINKKEKIRKKIDIENKKLQKQFNIESKEKIEKLDEELDDIIKQEKEYYRIKFDTFNF